MRCFNLQPSIVVLLLLLLDHAPSLRPLTLLLLLLKPQELLLNQILRFLRRLATSKLILIEPYFFQELYLLGTQFLGLSRFVGEGVELHGRRGFQVPSRTIIRRLRRESRSG